MRVIMVRHGSTPGNLRRRYIGTTDEPLDPQGVREVQALGRELAVRYPQGWPAGTEMVVSPLLRTRQTAAILLGGEAESPLLEARARDGLRVRIEPALRECDFGDFENQNYQELSGDPRYQRWIDSGGRMAFPGGESPAAFERRCREAFFQIMQTARTQSGADGGTAVRLLVLVVHGGSIMSIASAFAVDERGEPRSYYDWHLGNGQAFVFDVIGGLSDDHFLGGRGRIGLGEAVGAVCE